MTMLFDGVLVVVVLAMLVVTYRVATGPSNADRALALDLGFAVLIVGIAVLGLRLDQPAMLDLVLAATLVGFLGTVAVAKLVERSRR